MATTKKQSPVAKATNDNPAKVAKAKAKLTKREHILAKQKAVQDAIQRVTVLDANEQAASWMQRLMAALLAIWVARICATAGFNKERAAAMTLDAVKDADGNVVRGCVQMAPAFRNGSQGRWTSAADIADASHEESTILAAGVIGCGFTVKEAKNRKIGDLLFAEKAAKGLWGFVKEQMYGHIKPKDVQQSEVNALRVLLGLAVAKGTKESQEIRELNQQTQLRNDVKDALAVAGANTFAHVVAQAKDQSGKPTLTISGPGKQALPFGNLTARGLTPERQAELEAFEPVAIIGRSHIDTLADTLGISAEAVTKALADCLQLELQPYTPKAPKEETEAAKRKRKAKDAQNAADVATVERIEAKL